MIIEDYLNKSVNGLNLVNEKDLIEEYIKKFESPRSLMIDVLEQILHLQMCIEGILEENENRN